LNRAIRAERRYGEVDIGIQQLSELMSVSGTDVIGPLPADL
jgi:hypothetical protein